MSIGIGSKVFIFDSNNRVYGKDGHGGPIYRGHFVEQTIDGETSRSWIIGKGLSDAIKVNKKTLSGIYTAEQVDEACAAREWKIKHRANISRLIDHCESVETLKQVAAILEYKAE